MTAEYRTEALAEARSKWRAARDRLEMARHHESTVSVHERCAIYAEVEYWSNRMAFLDAPEDTP